MPYHRRPTPIAHQIQHIWTPKTFQEFSTPMRKYFDGQWGRFEAFWYDPSRNTRNLESSCFGYPFYVSVPATRSLVQLNHSSMFSHREPAARLVLGPEAYSDDIELRGRHSSPTLRPRRETRDVSLGTWPGIQVSFACGMLHCSATIMCRVCC